MKQHPPLVSIVMPAYQAAETLERSVRAVMDQSMPDWELLLLVDAATDDTVTIAERLASEDRRILLCGDSLKILHLFRKKSHKTLTLPTFHIYSASPA